MSIEMTQRLSLYGRRQNEKTFNFIKQRILHFKWKYLNRSPLYQAKRLHKNVDKLMSEMTGLMCKRACSNCCRQNIMVFKPETQLIDKYLKTHKVEIRTDGTACRFLSKENVCQIYPVRPAVCRAMVSKTDPINCLPGPEDKTKAVMVEAEILISGFAKHHKYFILENIKKPDDRFTLINPVPLDYLESQFY